jgi:hypothetical protein
LNGDVDVADSNISYSQTDPQTARFAESFKVKFIDYLPIKEIERIISLRQFINVSKTNIIV